MIKAVSLLLLLTALPALAQLNGQVGTCVYACTPGVACVCVPGTATLAPTPTPAPAQILPPQIDPLVLQLQQQQLDQLRRQQAIEEILRHGFGQRPPDAPDPHGPR